MEGQGGVAEGSGAGYTELYNELLPSADLDL
jgi:hypothetical protein